MIFHAMIVRSRDGVILTATSESDILPEVKEARRYLKLLAKKISRFPDRCSLRLNPNVIHFITTLGVSCITLCDAAYPNVLAFSFLDELVKEFISVYNTPTINNVIRPYSLIEFDTTIQKLRHRYNNPRHLTTKINLTDLSIEIKLRPPHLLTKYDIEPLNNGENSHLPLTIGPYPPRLLPISWLGIISMFLNVFIAMFNFARGIAALHSSDWQVDDNASPLYAFIFIVEGLLQCSQIYLLLHHIRRRNLLNFFCFAVVCLCNMSVWHVRDLWQIFAHVAIDAAITFSIVMRRIELKSSNFNV